MLRETLFEGMSVDDIHAASRSGRAGVRPIIIDSFRRGRRGLDRALNRRSDARRTMRSTTMLPP
jgi:hypothetical protein